MNVFKRLTEWKTAKEGVIRGEHRSWQVTSFANNLIKCSLSWKFGETQLGTVEYRSDIGEEAITIALDKFETWSREYYK